MEHALVCQSCGAEHPPEGYPTGCPDCRSTGEYGRLEVTYDPSSIPDDALPDPTGPTDAVGSMWRYRDLLPLLAESPVTLEEGGTPLVPADSLSPSGDVTVLLKNETVNPTWSYKDRLNSLLLSNAAALGESRIAVSSTGNHGASSAAYASRAGMDATIVLLPTETEVPLRAQIRAYGAHVVVTEYEKRDALLSALVDSGWYPTVNVTEEYVGLPYSYEAYKTIAFELVDQLGGVPDAVIAPIGAGDGLYGIWKGFRELRELDVIDEGPRMVGVQPAERPSVVEALEADSETVESVAGPMPITTSTSGGSAGPHALRAIRESAGLAVAIDRPSVETAVAETARAGILVEPSSALAPAAVGPALDEGVLDPGGTVVCMATGAGVKWPERVQAIVGSAPRIEPTIEALADAVDVSLDAFPDD